MKSSNEYALKVRTHELRLLCRCASRLLSFFTLCLAFYAKLPVFLFPFFPFQGCPDHGLIVLRGIPISLLLLLSFPPNFLSICAAAVWHQKRYSASNQTSAETSGVRAAHASCAPKYDHIPLRLDEASIIGQTILPCAAPVPCIQE